MNEQLNCQIHPKKIYSGLWYSCAKLGQRLSKKERHNLVFWKYISNSLVQIFSWRQTEETLRSDDRFIILCTHFCKIYIKRFWFIHVKCKINILKKAWKQRNGWVIKSESFPTNQTQGSVQWRNSCGSFRKLYLIHCCNFLRSIPAVGHNVAQRLRPGVSVLGLSEREEKKEEWGGNCL